MRKEGQHAAERRAEEGGQEPAEVDAVEGQVLREEAVQCRPCEPGFFQTAVNAKERGEGEAAPIDVRAGASKPVSQRQEYQDDDDGVEGDEEGNGNLDETRQTDVGGGKSEDGAP